MPRTAYVSGRAPHRRTSHAAVPDWSNLDEYYTTREPEPVEPLLGGNRDEMRASRAAEWLLAEDLRHRLLESVRSQSELMGSNLTRLLLHADARLALVGSGYVGVHPSVGSFGEPPDVLRPNLQPPPSPSTARSIERIADAAGLPRALKVVFDDEAE